MGSTLNSVEPLGPPFRSVDEQVFFLPRDGRHEIANRHFKVVVMLEGDCLHAVDDETPAPFAPGDVVVIPRACRQRYLARGPRTPRRVHALRLVLELSLREENRPGHRHADADTDFVAFLRHHLPKARHMPGEGDEVLRQLLAELRQEAEERRPGHHFRVTALCMTLMVHIVRRLDRLGPLAETTGANRRRTRAHLVLQAKEYLVKNLAAELRLNQMAWQLGVSPEHLARTFRGETGQTVFTHLRQLRLEKAKTHLLGSSRSITSIAELTGFSSVALFSRSFKRYAGCSPLGYRQERWANATGPPEARG